MLRAVLDQSLTRDIIGGAARRLAGFCTALREAHDHHGVEPGPHDELAAAGFHEAAEQIFRDSVSPEYLERIALTFGAVSVLMRVTEGMAPVVATNPKWEQVATYFTLFAERFEPGYKTELDRLPTLVLATQAAPAVIRFDLLAAQVSRAAVVRMFDAASWVAEIAPTLPELADGDLDPIEVAALAAALPAT
jgi:hypothetical protein